MEIDQFKKHAHELVEWMGNYLENIEEFPVISPLQPGEVAATMETTSSTAIDPIKTLYRDWGIQLGRRFRALKRCLYVENGDRPDPGSTAPRGCRLGTHQ